MPKQIVLSFDGEAIESSNDRGNPGLSLISLLRERERERENVASLLTDGKTRLMGKMYR